MSVFQRLTEHFKYTSIKLGQFVEEKQAIVGKADFTRLRVRATSYHCNLGYGMMGSPERSRSYQRIVLGQLAGYGVYLCGFKAFAQR